MPAAKMGCWRAWEAARAPSWGQIGQKCGAPCGGRTAGGISVGYGLGRSQSACGIRICKKNGADRPAGCRGGPPPDFPSQPTDRSLGWRHGAEFGPISSLVGAIRSKTPPCIQIQPGNGEDRPVNGRARPPHVSAGALLGPGGHAGLNNSAGLRSISVGPRWIVAPWACSIQGRSERAARVGGSPVRGADFLGAKHL